MSTAAYQAILRGWPSLFLATRGGCQWCMIAPAHVDWQAHRFSTSKNKPSSGVAFLIQEDTTADTPGSNDAAPQDTVTVADHLDAELKAVLLEYAKHVI